MAAWTDTDDELLDEQDENEQDEGAGEDDPGPEVQARIEAATARAVQEREKLVSASLREQGLDLSSDGRLVIRDPSAVARFFAPVVQRAGTGELLPPAGEPETTEPEDGAIPDVYGDPDGFARWLDRRTRSAVQASADRVRVLESMVANREASHAAVTVKRLLPQFPHLAHLADHPEFEQRFTAELSGLPPEQWSDPQFLVRVAGWLSPDMPPKTEPAAAGVPGAASGADTTRRDETGRFVARGGEAEVATRVALADAARGTVDQSRPASSLSRTATRGAEPTEAEREMAQFLRCSIAELRGLGQGGSGQSYSDAKARREAREEQRGKAVTR